MYAPNGVSSNFELLGYQASNFMATALPLVISNSPPGSQQTGPPMTPYMPSFASPYALTSPMTVSIASPYSVNASPYPATTIMPPIIPGFENIPTRVFVGSLANNINEADLESHFQKFGNILNVKIVRQSDGVHKGFGFITFATEEEAQKVRNLPEEDKHIKGRRVNLAPAYRRSYNWSPPPPIFMPSSPYAYPYQHSAPSFAVTMPSPMPIQWDTFGVPCTQICCTSNITSSQISTTAFPGSQSSQQSLTSNFGDNASGNLFQTEVDTHPMETETTVEDEIIAQQ